MKHLKKHKRFSRIKDHNGREFFLFEKKTFFLLIAVSILTLLVYFFGTDARKFLSSVVSLVPEHAPFDGTVAPLKQVPNWVKLNETERKSIFTGITQEKLMPLPAYMPERLAIPFENLKWNSQNDDQIRNEKITYTVPYLGNYELNGLENVGSHPAVDIKTPEKTPIYAIANGTVVKASYSSGGFGNHIAIQHNNFPSLGDPAIKERIFSAYAHLSEILVKENDVVAKGQLIALSGNTGASTTPHLHFQIDRDTSLWHPYWPFSGQDLKNAGYSFFQGINKGLNQNLAAANTINSMKYVQKYSSVTALVASTDISQVLQEDPFAKLKFIITPNAGPFYEGDNISFLIRIFDSNGNLWKNPSFEERVRVDILNSLGTLDRNYLTAGYFLTGETSAITLTNTRAGKEKLILRFRDLEFTSDEFEILTKSMVTSGTSLTEPLTPKIYTIEDTKRMPFPRLEVLIDKKSPKINEEVKVLVQLFNADAQNINPDEEDRFFVNAFNEGGKVTKPLLQKSDFTDGKAYLGFTPEKEGLTAIQIAGKGILGVSDAIEVENEAEPLAEAQPLFSDISVGSEYEEALKFLKEKGVVQGYGDNTFHPENEVLRVEALKMIFEALKAEINKDITSALFPDLEIGAWYIPYVKKAYDEKVVRGYPDGTFKPTAKVNMVEFYKMLFLAAKIDIDPEIIISLPNGVKADDWFAPYVQEAVKRNILEIKEDPLNPGRSMTRGDIVKALYKLLKT